MAGQPVIAANAPVNPMSEMAMVMQGYSPQTAMAAQRSQYLAQAMATMREQGQNIRTPAALGSDLLAQALLQRKYGQSMQDFAQAAAGDRARFGNDLFGDLRADDATPPAASPDVDGSGAQIPPPPAPPPVGGSAPPITSAPPQVAQFSPAVLRAIYGEDTHNPADQQAIAGVILRRAAMSGMTPDQVVATGGFEGAHNKWAQGATDADLQKVAANVSGAQTGPYDAFYSPGAQAALGRSPPAWDNGHGVDVGGNRFFGGVYAPPPSANPGVSMPGQPGPVQTANSGQNATTPSPSPSASVSSAPGGPASAPAAASPAAGASAPPQMLHAPVTQQEIDLAQQLYANPMTRQQGVALAIQLRERQAAQIAPKVQIQNGQAITYDPYGRTPPTATNIQGVRIDPTASVQGDKIVSYDPRDPTHPTITQIGLPTEVKPMMEADGHGGYRAVSTPLSQEKATQIFTDRMKSEAYTNWVASRDAWEAMKANAMQPGGVSAYAMRDTFMRLINPGAVARVGAMQAMNEESGIPENIKNFFRNLKGDGPVSPQMAQQILNSAYPFLKAHYDTALREQNGLVSLYKKQGWDPSAVELDLGDAPSPFSVGPGGRPPINQAPGVAPFGVTPQPAGAAQQRFLTYDPTTGTLR